MKLESFHAPEDKAKYKIVRRDDCTDVAGDIVAADEATGECVISFIDQDGKTQTKQYSFGANGMRIVMRK